MGIFERYAGEGDKIRWEGGGPDENSFCKPKIAQTLKTLCKVINWINLSNVNFSARNDKNILHMFAVFWHICVQKQA